MEKVILAEYERESKKGALARAADNGAGVATGTID
jgi:hypothetical protein